MAPLTRHHTVNWQQSELDSEANLGEFNHGWEKTVCGLGVLKFANEAWAMAPQC
jgi:hypothetical protein